MTFEKWRNESHPHTDSAWHWRVSELWAKSRGHALRRIAVVLVELVVLVYLWATLELESLTALVMVLVTLAFCYTVYLLLGPYRREHGAE